MSSESLKKNDKVRDYIIEKKIGEGAFGKTYLAKKGEKKYVLKITGVNSRGNGKEKEISDYIKDNMIKKKIYFIMMNTLTKIIKIFLFQNILVIH